MLENACLIVAMRALLGDPDWAPPEVVALIAAGDGYPSRENHRLERLAPVRVFCDCTITYAPGGPMQIAAGSSSVALGVGDRLILGRRTDPGRGHLECMGVPEAVRLLDGLSAPETEEIYVVIVRADRCIASFSTSFEVEKEAMAGL